VEADAALAGAPGGVVVHPPSHEHLDGAVVHAHRHGHLEDALAAAEQAVDGGVGAREHRRVVQTLEDVGPRR
jgi:hypothetical protein